MRKKKDALNSDEQPKERKVSVVLSEESYLKLRLLAFQNRMSEEQIVCELVNAGIDRKIDKLKPEMTKMFEEFKKIL